MQLVCTVLQCDVAMLTLLDSSQVGLVFFFGIAMLAQSHSSLYNA